MAVSIMVYQENHHCNLFFMLSATQKERSDSETHTTEIKGCGERQCNTQEAIFRNKK